MLKFCDIGLLYMGYECLLSYWYCFFQTICRVLNFLCHASCSRASINYFWVLLWTWNKLLNFDHTLLIQEWSVMSTSTMMNLLMICIVPTAYQIGSILYWTSSQKIYWNSSGDFSIGAVDLILVLVELLFHID